MPELKDQLVAYLDDVVERVDASQILAFDASSLEPLEPAEAGSHKPGWLYAVAAASVVAVLIGGLGYLVVAGSDSPSSPPGDEVNPLDLPLPSAAPTLNTVGMRDLPSEGAVPSEPVVGELVFGLWTHVVQAEDNAWFGWGSIYLYDDGRLIWQSLYPGDATGHTGLVEQRLTKEGVALLRQEVLDSGLFGPDAVESHRGLPALGWLVAKVGDGFEVRWNRDFVDDPIHDRLISIHSWLPARAWADPVPREYVPTHYELCVTNEPRPTLEPDSETDTENTQPLPFSVREILVSATPSHLRWPPYENDDTRESKYHHCYDVTTDQARFIVGEFDDSPFLERSDNDVRTAYEGSVWGARSIYVTLTPFLPHEAPEF